MNDIEKMIEEKSEAEFIKKLEGDDRWDSRELGADERFVRPAREVEYRKVFIVERREADGWGENSVWMAYHFSEVKKIVASFLEKSEDEISIVMDMLAKNYNNSPSFVGDVIVKAADSITERLDLDNQGFPRTRLHTGMIPFKDFSAIDDEDQKNEKLKLLIK